jgi:outer membrane protein assembly factor BamB
MPHLRTPALAAAAAAALAAAACGSSTAESGPAPSTAPPGPAAKASAASRNFDWPTFDLVASRSGATSRATGITAANAGRLVRRRVALPGTVDSSPIYLHGVVAGGKRRDVFVMTTTYGRSLALDAATGRVVWTFTPRGYSSWAGSSRITNASPTADSDRAHVFTASPDGRIHRLRLADGGEAAGWPVAITRDPTHEKVTSSLNLSRGRVIAMTGGYIGDAPPYQGHVVTLDHRTGRIAGVFNSLCSDRKAIQTPSTCRSSDSAIWSRAGASVMGDGNLLVATGNAPFDGRRDWGDSALMLSPDARRLLRNWTPANQRALEAGDADLGSTSPAILPGGYALQGGKEGRMVVLGLGRMNGRTTTAGPLEGGERQSLRQPGGAGVFTHPAVWRHGSRTTVFVTSQSGTAAYSWRGHRLRALWSNGTTGTSPIVAGGLLYVFDPGGSLVVYRPGSGRVVARLPAGAGHWNSPVIGGGRIALPEGNANEHRTSGTLSLYVRR